MQSIGRVYDPRIGVTSDIADVDELVGAFAYFVVRDDLARQAIDPTLRRPLNLTILKVAAVGV